MFNLNGEQESINFLEMGEFKLGSRNTALCCLSNVMITINCFGLNLIIHEVGCGIVGVVIINPPP